MAVYLRGMSLRCPSFFVQLGLMVCNLGPYSLSLDPALVINRLHHQHLFLNRLIGAIQCSGRPMNWLGPASGDLGLIAL